MTANIYAEKELKEKLKTAYNFEARAGHGKENLPTVQIGTVKRGNRLYDLYEDSSNSVWFKERVITDHGIVSEFEAIFGHPARAAGSRRQMRNV